MVAGARSWELKPADTKQRTNQKGPWSSEFSKPAPAPSTSGAAALHCYLPKQPRPPRNMYEHTWADGVQTTTKMKRTWQCHICIPLKHVKWNWPVQKENWDKLFDKISTTGEAFPPLFIASEGSKTEALNKNTSHVGKWQCIYRTLSNTRYSLFMFRQATQRTVHIHQEGCICKSQRIDWCMLEDSRLCNHFLCWLRYGSKHNKDLPYFGLSKQLQHI